MSPIMLHGELLVILTCKQLNNNELNIKPISCQEI